MNRNLPMLCVYALIVLSSCAKVSNTTDDTCAKIKALKITGNTKVLIDSTINFSVPDIDGNRIFLWTGPDNFNTSAPSVSIGNASLKNEGWYYLNVSSNGCDTKIDSIYIDILLKQGTPACSIASNTTIYNNQGNDSYGSVRKSIESTYGLFSLDATTGGNMFIYFHPEWRTHEPEDGIYTTTNVPLFSQVDFDYNKVFISTVKSSIYWASWEGQQVYVSHVSGKLQVRFCNLNMGGNNGMSYTTIASGNVTER